MHEALRKKGIESTRYLIPHALHGGDYWVQPEVMQVIRAFFDKELKGKEVNLDKSAEEVSSRTRKSCYVQKHITALFYISVVS